MGILIQVIIYDFFNLSILAGLQVAHDALTIHIEHLPKQLEGPHLQCIINRIINNNPPH